MDMTPEQFKAWRQHLGLNQKQAAAKLGVSGQTVWLYEKGEREEGRPVEIPKPVRLACAAIALGLDDYHGPE